MDALPNRLMVVQRVDGYGVLPNMMPNDLTRNIDLNLWHHYYSEYNCL